MVLRMLGSHSTCLITLTEDLGEEATQLDQVFITKELNSCGETCLLDAYIFITRFFIIWKIQAIWRLQTMFTCFACIMCLKRQSTSILNGSLLDRTTIPLGQQGTGHPISCG